MKKIVFICIVLTLISCTRYSCVDYLISNKHYSELSIPDRGGNSITYSGIDSIEIKVDNVVRKIYKPTAQDKSIYKTEDQNSWKLVESKSHYSKFMFEIGEEDLN